MEQCRLWSCHVITPMQMPMPMPMPMPIPISMLPTYCTRVLSYCNTYRQPVGFGLSVFKEIVVPIQGRIFQKKRAFINLWGLFCAFRVFPDSWPSFGVRPNAAERSCSWITDEHYYYYCSPSFRYAIIWCGHIQY